jgi:hypothetical protein
LNYRDLVFAQLLNSQTTNDAIQALPSLDGEVVDIRNLNLRRATYLPVEPCAATTVDYFVAPAANSIVYKSNPSAHVSTSKEIASDAISRRVVLTRSKRNCREIEYRVPVVFELAKAYIPPISKAQLKDAVKRFWEGNHNLTSFNTQDVSLVTPPSLFKDNVELHNSDSESSFNSDFIDEIIARIEARSNFSDHAENGYVYCTRFQKEDWNDIGELQDEEDCSILLEQQDETVSVGTDNESPLDISDDNLLLFKDE